ncbi:unnamed protein product [Auanema sp. JU1783]|nr:unnamed protein product [Auanema sp. JU1783]
MSLATVLSSFKECVAAFFSNFIPSAQAKQKIITGQVVLITGAGNGLGKLMAIEFAKLKACLVLWDVDESSLLTVKTACENLGADVNTGIVDISDRHNVYGEADIVLNKFQKIIDILINNAGILRKGGSFLLKDDESMEKTVQINMVSHFWLAKAFLPGMVATNSGHIVSVCSLAGLVGAFDLVDYSASKFGAFGFQEALENEVYNQGYKNIKFTTVCPSFVATNMLSEIPSLTSPNVLDPKLVVDNIIRAILTEMRILILPNTAYFLYAIKGLVPRSVFQKILLWNLNNYS